MQISGSHVHCKYAYMYTLPYFPSTFFLEIFGIIFFGRTSRSENIIIKHYMYVSLINFLKVENFLKISLFEVHVCGIFLCESFVKYSSVCTSSFSASCHLPGLSFAAVSDQRRGTASL